MSPTWRTGCFYPQVGERSYHEMKAIYIANRANTTAAPRVPKVIEGSDAAPVKATGDVDAAPVGRATELKVVTPAA